MNIDALKRRAAIIKDIRAFFDSRGFTEVETPVRIAAPAPEPHIDCPPVTTGGFLRASPELQMKKLLAAGMDRIYQIGPCFRDGEKGSRHNPEFTMIEWYRLDADYMDILRDTEALLFSLGLGRDDKAPALEADFKRLTVREAYRKYANWDPFEGDWNQDRFDFDMAVAVEEALKNMDGVFLMDYPPQCASLAKVENGVAQRWEFYWRGLELANCFSELCDSDEQLRRFLDAKAERIVLGEADYPLDEAFLSKVASIRRASGVALGIDRLIMAILGESSISSIRILD
ncbi:MAG: EF-P lysine aminoacylase GenX [Kiritimatiellae bacterium]|nr:EF-P lysine aminoacylase GenX [Kiritimatiellia bacterium]